MPFTIIRQDITKLRVDAIVNSTNNNLSIGIGVSAAIHKAAGTIELQKACEQISPIKTGCAAITPAFNLPAKYIIHTVGPKYYLFNMKHAKVLLRSAYEESLKLAVENKCKSIAFPLISSGWYNYPKEEALKIATTTIKEFLDKHDLNIYLVVFDKKSFSISKKLSGYVKNYINQKTIEEQNTLLYALEEIIDSDKIQFSIESTNSGKNVSTYFQYDPNKIEELVEKVESPFHETLLALMQAKGLNSNKEKSKVYKKANITRQNYSKIINGKTTPTKRTILALAIGLELNLEETKTLLQNAGFTFTHSQIFDIIVEYFIVTKNYDVFEINNVLFEYDQALLGSN